VSYASGVSLTPTSDPIRVSEAMVKYKIKKQTAQRHVSILSEEKK